MAISDEIKEQTNKFKDMTPKEKANYIWDYYKIPIIVVVVLLIGGAVLLSDVKKNMRPTYISVAMINTNFSYDSTNTLQDDFVRCANINLEENNIYFGLDYNFPDDFFDTTTMAYQQRLVSQYSANELDIVIGPVKPMVTAADCGGYADLTKILPKELIDDLTERGYEFFTYNGRQYTDEEKSYMSEEDLEELDNFEPYIAGIYLDNCSYLNNQGEYGAYDLATSEDERPILTVPFTTQRLDHAIEFIKFLTE